MTYEEYLRAQGLRPKTIRAYVLAVEFAHRSGDPVGAVQAAKSPGRRALLIPALKSWAKWQGASGAPLLEALAALPRSRLREAAPDRPLDDAQWGRLLGACRGQAAPMDDILRVLILTGLRVNDVLGIERRRVSQGLQDGTLWLEQKGGYQRPLPVMGEIAGALGGLLGHGKWGTVRDLAATRSSTEIAAYMAVYRSLKEVAVDAGLDPRVMHPHLLRTTAAVQLYKQTKDLLLVQKWLGHKNIATTQRYLRFLDPEDLTGAYEKLQAARRQT